MLFALIKIFAIPHLNIRSIDGCTCYNLCIMSDQFTQELHKLIDHLSNIPITAKLEANEFGYDNPVDICMDAVLSIRRKYYSFVVPRLEYFRENQPEIRSLQRLAALIRSAGHEEFCKLWNYNHFARVELLENLVQRFIAYNTENNFEEELKGMQHWARLSSPQDYRRFGVKGIGLATFQYLRMLLGVQTVKPDVHIKKAISLALGRKISDAEAITFIEKASQKLDLPATVLDHNIWRYYAEKPTE